MQQPVLKGSTKGDAPMQTEIAYTSMPASAHHLSAACGCSTVGAEDFQDVSLETQDGKPVLMNDTDREALVMGMTLHDKAQQFLQKVSIHTFSLHFYTRTLA